MKTKFKRFVNLMLSFLILASGLPAFAEEDFDLVVAQVEMDEAYSASNPISEEIPEGEMEVSSMVVLESTPDAASDVQEPVSETVEIPDLNTEPTQLPEPEFSDVNVEEQIPQEPQIPLTTETPDETDVSETTEEIAVVEMLVSAEGASLIQSSTELADALGVTIEELTEALEISIDELNSMSPQELTSVYEVVLEMYSGAATMSIEPEFDIDDTNKLLSYAGSSGNVIVPDGVVTIGYGAFKDNASIVSVTLPSSVVCIEESAFAGCGQLSAINMSEAVQRIDALAFADCAALAELELPASLEQIADNAFEGCNALNIQLSKGSFAENYCIEKSIPYTYSDSTVPQQIVPASSNLVIGVQERVSVADYQFLPAGTQDIVYYSSNSERIAAVNEEGMVTGKVAGETDIFLRTEAGLTAQIHVVVKKAPSSIRIDGLRSKLGVGEILDFGYALSSGSAGSVEFFSDNAAVAKFLPRNRLEAVGIGKTKITAKTYNGKTKTVEIQVYPEPTTLTLSSDTLTIGVNDTRVLQYAIDPGSVGVVDYQCTDSSVVSVEQDGVVRALQVGSTEIIVETYNGIRQICSVTVVPEPTEISLMAERTNIGIGEKYQLTTSLVPVETVGTIKYKSSNTKVAKVDANGVVSGKKAGKATITATAYNGMKATFVISVKKAPTSVSLVSERKTIGLGEELQLGYKLSSGASGAVSFKSLNEDIATVTPAGLLKGEALGFATIEVRSYNGKYKRVQFEVKAAPADVTPSKTEIIIGKGDSWALGYTLSEGSAGAVYFITDNPEIAMLDEKGKIYANEVGEAIITLETYNHERAQCKVTVVPEPELVSMSAVRSTIGIGEKLQMETLVLPEATVGTIKYKSSNTKVAKVDANGVVSGKKAGKATITATAYNGVKATFVVSVKKAPTSVSLVSERKTIGLGEELQLGYKLSSGASGAVSFKSLNEDIATVTPAGLLKGEALGLATVEVRSYNGKYKRVQFEVKAAPANVTPSKTEIIIGKGDSWALGYTLSEGSAGAVHFISDNPEIAVPDEKGTIYANEVGEAIITLETYNHERAECKVTVVPEPELVSMSAVRSTIGIGEKLQMETLVLPEATVGTIKYKSSNTKVAKVDANGVVTGKKAGKATITATAYNGTKATFVVSVKKAPTSVSLVSERKTIGLGEELQLGYKLSSGASGAVSFKSLNEDIATVTPAGLLKGEALGFATIEVRSYNGKYKRVQFEVKAAPTVVIPAKGEVSIGVKDSWVLGYSLDENAAGEVKFSSTDPSVATVDEKGKISALKEGTAIVWVTAYNEVSDSCIVTVVPEPTSIEVSETSIEIGLKEAVQLSPKQLPNETVGELRYTSSKSSVVSVSSTGVLTGKKVGTATITIKAYNGISETVQVRVVKAPTSIKVSAERSVLGVGETLQFTAKLSSGSSGYYSFSSENPEVIWIDPLTGEAQALSVGKTVIKATTYNKIVGQFNVQVLNAPTGISISPDAMIVGAGDECRVSAELNEGEMGAYFFSSLDESIAIVDEQEGRIFALREGEVKIKAETFNGVSATTTLTIIAPPEKIELIGLELNGDDIYDLKLDKGESYQIQVNSAPYSNLTMSYISENSDIAEVTPDGLILAKRSGTVMIDAIAYNNAYASIKLEIAKWTDDFTGRAFSHAMGGIGGKSYSNSLEAFRENYEQGFRIFEADISYTSDGELVLWHDWDKDRINSSKKLGYVPSLSEFKKLKIYDKYTSLSYKDLLKIMSDHPNIHVITDTKLENSTSAAKQFRKMVNDANKWGYAHVLDRFIVQVYNKGMFESVSSIYPFKQYAFTLYNYFSKKPTVSQFKDIASFCTNNGIDLVVMPKNWWSIQYCDLMEKYDVDVAVHTVNSVADAKQFFKQGVKAVYTDFLSPKGD